MIVYTDSPYSFKKKMYCLPVKALQYTHCALCCGVNIIILWGVMFPNNCVTGAHALSIWLDFWMKVIAGLCGWFNRNSLSTSNSSLGYPHSIQFLLVIVYTNWKQILIRFQQKYHAGSGYLAKGRNHIYVWQKFLQYSASKGISLGVCPGTRWLKDSIPILSPLTPYTHTHSWPDSLKLYTLTIC